jgi:putative Mg2+ transporter-C (MgtC) family protein
MVGANRPNPGRTMRALSLWEMFLRVFVAFIAGALIGWERESHGRPAGLRTTILTCVASAVAMVISEVLFVESAGTATGSWRPDPARLGAGILTGIGFLGAGTILKHDNAIRGVTTAATLWFVTVLGLAFGSGQFQLGAIGAGLALMTLFMLPLFEKHIPTDWYATLSVTTALETLSPEELRRRVEALGPVVKAMRLSYDIERQRQTFVCDVKVEKSRVPELSVKVLADLRLCPGVQRVRWF